MRTAYDEDAGWLTVARGPVTVACNLGKDTWTCPAGTRAELLAASDDAIGRDDGGIVLPPETVAILINLTCTSRCERTLLPDDRPELAG